jgi:hypothetical protein
MSEKVKVRLLRDSSLGACDQVVELDSEQAKQAVESGAADDNKAAVKFAEAEAKAKAKKPEGE